MTPAAALRDVRVAHGSFTLECDALLAGPCTAVLGASGSGKTTLLECVAGIVRPSRGRVEMTGDVVSDCATGAFTPAWKRAVGYVPQEGALFPHLDVRANLLYGARGEDAELARVADVLELAPFLARSVRTLSGGEKRRVALGRALLSSPRILLLDEPFTGLDRRLKDQAVALVRRVRTDFAVPLILVTHDEREADALATSFVRLDAGRVVERSAPR